MKGLRVSHSRRAAAAWAGLCLFTACTTTVVPADRDRDPANVETTFADDASTVSPDLQPVVKDCYRADLGLPVPKNLKVNGHVLNATEAKNVQWIALCVVPYLPGSAGEQVETAAKTTWWALREGILDRTAENLFRYSNCHEKNGKDKIRSSTPLYDCPTNIWQVGMPAGQVANYSDAAVASVIERLKPGLHPDLDAASLMRWATVLSGFGPETPEYAGILKSKARVRRSWLLRNPLVGFPLVGEQEVDRECIRGQHKWCTAGDYPTAVRYSHTRAGVQRAIGDLRKIFSEGRAK